MHKAHPWKDKSLFPCQEFYSSHKSSQELPPSPLCSPLRRALPIRYRGVWCRGGGSAAPPGSPGSHRSSAAGITAVTCLPVPLVQCKQKASDPTTRPNRLHTHTHSTKCLAHPRSPIPPLSTLTARETLARPLHPAALASVPSGIVLVRVRVRKQK
jgi:hypothetical protein